MLPLCPTWHTRKEPHLQQVLKVPPPKCVKPVLKSTLKYPISGVSYFLKIWAPGLGGWPRVVHGQSLVCVSDRWAVLPWIALLCPSDSGCPCDPTMMPVTIWLPLRISSPFCSRDCLLCAASSIKTAGRAVDMDSCLCSALSSTVSLLTPAVAASWALMVSCIYF